MVEAEIPFYLNWSFWAVVIAAIAVFLSQIPPIKELIKFPYFKYALAKEIVTYRSMNSGIKNIDDLTKIKGFPVDKIKIIALYLEF